MGLGRSLMIVPALAAAIGAAAAQGQTPPARVPLRYDVTILPGSKAIYVEGLLQGARNPEGGWIAAAGGLGDATQLPAAANQFRFAYSVPIPQRERSNSPETELNGSRLRSWGTGIFLIPSLKDAEAGPIEVCFRTPQSWELVTSAGSASCTTVAGPDELFSLPILAGDYRRHLFQAGPAQVTLALRAGHPVAPEAFAEKLRRLVIGASDYLATPPPPQIFFGVDRLGEGRTTYAPGNNESGPGLSSTLLIDSDGAVGGRKYWGTYAHEFVHSWIPRGFGNPSVTRQELGSTFIEGFSDYLAYRIAYSSGLLDRAAFLAALSEFYLEYGEARARAPQGNPEFLRYRQGMMAAWMLDLELLKATRGRAGFRELMRLLVQRHLRTDGITRDEMKDALRTLGGEQAAALYDPLTDIARPIDFARHLQGTGIVLQPVTDFTAAIERGQGAVTLMPRGSAQRRFLTRWERG